MKRLIVILSMMVFLMSAYSQPEKWIGCSDKSNEGFFLFLREVNKNQDLYLFYEQMKKNPYIKGLPDDYIEFKIVMGNQEAANWLYRSLMINPKYYSDTTFDLIRYYIEEIVDFDKINARDDQLNNYYNPSIYYSIPDPGLEQRLKMERTNSLLNASRLIFDAIGGSMGATIPDYYNYKQYQQQDRSVIYQTYPGTNISDYTSPGFVIEDNMIYQTYPGTTIKDLTKTGIVIEGDMAYPTYPGTNIRDYSMPGLKIERK